MTVDPDIDVFALAPTFIWVSPWQVLGARYGAYIAPSFADGSAQVSLSVESGRFLDGGFSTGALEADTGMGVGDLFVQPLWLGWSGKHYDVSAGYGVYAPTGEENIGLEFWTNQFQLAGAWYPFENRGTAVTLAGTYEIHSEMEDKDLTRGIGSRSTGASVKICRSPRTRPGLRSWVRAATASGRSRRTRARMCANLEVGRPTQCQGRGPRRGHPGRVDVRAVEGRAHGSLPVGVRRRGAFPFAPRPSVCATGHPSHSRTLGLAASDSFCRDRPASGTPRRYRSRVPSLNDSTPSI